MCELVNFGLVLSKLLTKSILYLSLKVVILLFLVYLAKRAFDKAPKFLKFLLSPNCYNIIDRNILQINRSQFPPLRLLFEPVNNVSSNGVVERFARA